MQRETRILYTTDKALEHRWYQRNISVSQTGYCRCNLKRSRNAETAVRQRSAGTQQITRIADDHAARGVETQYWPRRRQGSKRGVEFGAV